MPVAETKVIPPSALPLNPAITLVTFICIGDVNTSQETRLSELCVLLLKNVLEFIILGDNEVEFVPPIAI